MKKLIAIMILILSLAWLTSCNKDADVPEGLQLADKNETDGYVFYAPEGWSLSNRAGISAAYVSPINITSISFAPADAPSVPLSQYFDESMAKLPYSISIIKRDEKCAFGNSADAYKYIYTYEYQDYVFSSMQILVYYGDGFYIFTYNAYGATSDADSDYNKYLESVQLAIDSFKFTEAPSKDSVGTASGEYVLVSDRDVAGFDLYLPDAYTVVDDGAIVTAKISDGAVVSLSKASQTGVSILDYLKLRHEELGHLVTEIKDIRIATPIDVTDINPDYFNDWPIEVKPEMDASVILGDLGQNVVCYEYTYEFAGERYHVYQLLGVDRRNGYVFTYTAKEAEYASHLDEINEILKKVKF